MLTSLLLPTLERMLNQYLRLDKEMQQRLKKHHGRIIRFCLSTFELTFYIEIEGEKLRLKSHHEKPIDASIKISLTDLVKNVIDDKTEFSKTMELQGDTQLIQAITNIFKSIEIDWEELVARCAGDTIAHDVGNVLRDIKRKKEEIFSTQKKNITEYLQEEINLLVHPYATEDFCKDIDEFRDKVECLNARITILRDQVEKN